VQKPSCPQGQDRLLVCKNYCGFLSLSFSASLEGAGAPDPAAALPPLGELVELELVEPPAAWSFFSGEPGAVLTEPDGAVDGLLGVVVEPAEEDEPDGGVVFETARSPSLSQPVSSPAPSAKDTATAKVESLIR
jgi:hypothetical protein